MATKVPTALQINTVDLVTSAAWPIIRLQMWGFVIFNLLLAYGLWIVHSQVLFIVVNSELVLRVSAIFFLTVGLVKAFALRTEDTNLLRILLLVTIFARSTWLVILLLHVFLGGSILLAALWAIILFVELTIYVFLLKKPKQYESP